MHRFSTCEGNIWRTLFTHKVYDYQRKKISTALKYYAAPANSSDNGPVHIKVLTLYKQLDPSFTAP